MSTVKDPILSMQTKVNKLKPSGFVQTSTGGKFGATAP
uniref:Uncharacterized protein n=1 Tax=Caenorhabditis japonica TaxID=281687 RepID=A0A8R1IL48_CAEJA